MTCTITPQLRTLSAYDLVLELDNLPLISTQSIAVTFSSRTNPPDVVTYLPTVALSTLIHVLDTDIQAPGLYDIAVTITRTSGQITKMDVTPSVIRFI